MTTAKLLLSLCLIAGTASAEIRTLGLDYDVTDVVAKPLSVGVTSLHYKSDNNIGVFGSISCMTVDDILRLELGGIFAVSDGLDVHILTGLSTPVLDEFTVGVWYASFWNTYHPATSDDPWGIMVGYRF